jgi:multiple sugar transport system permease protein
MSAVALPRDHLSRQGLSTWQVWGAVLLAPYVLVFLAFVIYPVSYGLWLARDPDSYRTLFEDPVFLPTVVNTIVFLLVAVNVKFVLALFLSGFFVQERRWIRWLSVIFIIPWAVPAIPTIFSIRFMLNPEWGVVNSLIFRLTGADGPNWLSNPALALSMAGVVHIWKALPFWTLILVAGRLAIPRELYEAASVDGATAWQKFRYVTWPSIKTLYLTSTLLSLIWTLGDFNSVYLLTGGQPADKTHVLATLGIRYIRLDQLDHAMATIVVALPFVLPLVYFMMKRLSKNESE